MSLESGRLPLTEEQLTQYFKEILVQGIVPEIVIEDKPAGRWQYDVGIHLKLPGNTVFLSLDMKFRGFDDGFVDKRRKVVESLLSRTINEFMSSTQ